MSKFKVSSVYDITAPISFEFEGGEIEMVTRPHSLTTGYLDSLEGEKNSKIQMFERAIVSWNLVDDKNKPLPINEEGFKLLPGSLIHAITMQLLTATGEAKKPNSTE